MSIDISFEVMPLPGLDDQIRFLPKGVLVGITCSVKQGIEATLHYCEKLQKLGFKVEPHINARMVRDFKHLVEIFSRLKRIGVDDVLVIGGDSEKPTGKYQSSAELLADLVRSKISFGQIGIVGYPEGHPFLSKQLTIENLLLKQAIIKKMSINMYILTQMCGEANLIIDWIKEIRRSGVKLPVIVGVPAPIRNERILEIAIKVGVAGSFMQLKSNLSSTFPGLEMINMIKDDPDFDKLNITGFQIFTFNQLFERMRGFEDVTSKIPL